MEIMEEPRLDPNKTYLCKLLDVSRDEAEFGGRILFSFATCDLPTPVFITGICNADLAEGSILHRWLMTMHGSLLDIDSDAFEIGYITGSYVDLKVESYTRTICGETMYYVNDIVRLIRIPLHASSDEYQVDPEFLERTPI
jgi:hypothetical protein